MIEMTTETKAQTIKTSYHPGLLVCEEAGVGSPPVLLLHGWGGNAESLSPIATRLAPGRKTIRVALPGFGGSPEPAQPWGTTDYVEVIRHWINANHAGEKLDLIAHSFGGRVAIGLAARYSELVNSLVLIGSAGLRPKRPVELKLKRLWARQLRNIGGMVGGEFAKKIEGARQRLGSEDWRKASPLMRGTLSKVLEEDMSCELKQIACPTLLIWGAQDTATPLWMGKAMGLLIPGAELVVLEKAGHYCFLDKPGETLAAIWKHLGLKEAW